MTVNIPRIRSDEPWNSRNVDTWREVLRAQVLENDRRITTSYRGLYDQTTDTIAGGGALDAASNYTPGEYYTCSANGVFVTPIPELNGQSAGVGDQVISNGAQWQLLDFSGAYLSSQVADTANGVITHVPAPISNTAAAAGTELMRKQESDAGDAAVQGNLDAHIGQLYTTHDPHGITAHTDDASIHFADAPADGAVYGRSDNDWTLARDEIAILRGVPSSFTLGTGITTISGWPTAATNSPSTYIVNGTTGEITVNATGVYLLSASLIGLQGNDTKEEDIYLWLRNSVSGDEELWSYHVATDKGANYRPLGRSLYLDFNALEQVSIGMQATAGLGTFTFINASFSLSKVEL